jgi:hypothetical protein
MLSADHPLASLQTLAALASGWPTLHVFRPDESSVLAARQALEERTGTLPQADVIEPWDPTDPAEPWELRVDLPELDQEGWLRVKGALAVAEGADPVLVPGLRPGAREARDQGYHFDQDLEAGGLIASMTCREEGGIVVPDLERGRADDDIRILEQEIAIALQDAGVVVPFTTDRGSDTVQPVVHRASGRFGIQLSFPPAHLDPLPGDELHALRVTIVGVLADIVRARAEHERVRLAPDLGWNMQWGSTFTLWFVGPAAPGLPGDAPLRSGISPDPDAVPPLMAGLGGLVEEVEVQVVPIDGPAHDPVVAAVMAMAERAEVRLLGGRPRWVRLQTASGLQWVFAPTWRVLVGDPGWDALPGVLRDLAGLDQVAAVRLVPGEPNGLGEAWGQAEPGWHLGDRRWFLRIRDGLTDRDRLPEVEERSLEVQDRTLSADVARALEVLGDAPQPVPSVTGLVRAVADTAGRAGVELRLDATGAREAPLRVVLDALGALEMEDLCTLAHWGYQESSPLLYLWFR